MISERWTFSERGPPRASRIGKQGVDVSRPHAKEIREEEHNVITKQRPHDNDNLHLNKVQLIQIETRLKMDSQRPASLKRLKELLRWQRQVAATVKAIAAGSTCHVLWCLTWRSFTGGSRNQPSQKRKASL